MIYPAPAHYIIVDAPITRRKRFHCLMHPAGVAIYKSRLFSEIIEAARATGLSQVELRHAEADATDAPLALLNLEGN